MAKKSRHLSALCACGHAQPYDNCCALYINGIQPAPTAEALMRSRYVAYAMNHADYLLKTWHVSTRPTSLVLTVETNPLWCGLDIKHYHSDEDHAIVEFVARYKVNGRAHLLHETSRFVREHGLWFYVDGDFHENKK